MSFLLNALSERPFVLAPMAGITETGFRTFMKKMGSGPLISELISAHGIEYQSQNTIRMLRIGSEERPVAIQLFGEEPEIVAKAAKFVQEQGADWVDLNFGCPVPKVVKKGAGSAILKDMLALEKMISTVKKAITIPLTIKIRTGWDEMQRNAVEVARLAHDQGVEWVAIHGRTRAQGYSGLADWEFIGDVKAKSKIPILGNGDIHSGLQAVRRLREFGLDGVMIGRGALKNPWIFQEAMAEWTRAEDAGGGGADSLKSQDREFLQVFRLLRECLELNADERVLQIQLKKFAAWYSAGYPGASQFRRKLFQMESLDELELLIEGYFGALQILSRTDTSGEAFLMGGHG